MSRGRQPSRRRRAWKRGWHRAVADPGRSATATSTVTYTTTAGGRRPLPPSRSRARAGRARRRPARRARRRAPRRPAAPAVRTRRGSARCAACAGSRRTRRRRPRSRPAAAAAARRVSVSTSANRSRRIGCRTSAAYGAGGAARGAASSSWRCTSWWQHGRGEHDRRAPARRRGPARRPWPCRRRAGRARRRRSPSAIGALDRADGERQPRRSPSSPASAVLRSTRSGRTSTPSVRTSARQRSREVPVRGEGQVGVAAAEVDDPQRAPGRAAARRPAGAATSCRRNASTWRRLSASAPSTANSGSPGSSRCCFARSCAVAASRPGVAGRRCRCTCASPLLVTRSWITSSRGLDVPVAERLGEQRVDGALRVLARRRGSPCGRRDGVSRRSS